MQPHKVLVRKVVITKKITIIKPPKTVSTAGFQRSELYGLDARRQRSRAGVHGAAPRRTPPLPPRRPRRPPPRSQPPPPELSRHSANPQTAALEPKPMSQRSLIPVSTAAGIAPAAVDREFPLMGTHMRVVVGAPVARRPALLRRRRRRGRRATSRTTTRGSRAFAPDSELSLLNADPRETVPASDLLRDAVRAALWAASRTGGLVDPTVLDDLEAAGYVGVLEPRAPRWTCATALAGDRPAAAGARPRRAAALAADHRRRRRGHDHAARRACGSTPAAPARATPPSSRASCSRATTPGPSTAAATCASAATPALVRDVEVEHPFSGETLETIKVRDGAVATSGLRSRIWRGADGDVRHHLLDPSTGRPAFTGLVAVTALAPSAVEAEALAKAGAALRGPRGARTVLAAHGGITVDEDGAVERIGRLEPAPRVRFRLPSRTIQPPRSAA